MPQRAVYIKAVCAIAFLVVCCGCLLEAEDVYKEIRLSRARSYDAWSQERSGAGASRRRLEGDLTLDAAVLIAMGNNKQLRAILQEKEVARGRITEAYAQALPKIDIESGYTFLDKVAGFDVAGRDVSLGDRENWSIAATLRQPIFRGGAIAAGIRAARLYRYFADERVNTVKQQVIFAVRKAYYDALLAKELAEVSQGDLSVAKRHLADVKKRRAHDDATDFDVLRAAVEVSNFEAELIRRRNDRRIAFTKLLRAMGASQESGVTLSDTLEYESATPKLASSVERAFASRPDLLTAELGIRLQREAVKAAKSGWWPRADLFFTEKLTRPDPHMPTEIHWGTAWETGINLTYPLFDGFRTAGKVRQEDAELTRKIIQLHDAEEQVLLDVKQALLRLEDAEKLVKSQSRNIDRAREGLGLSETSYRGGVATEVEVIDARQALSRTQALYFEAVHSHVLARLALERATGSLEAPAEDETAELLKE